MNLLKTTESTNQNDQFSFLSLKDLKVLLESELIILKQLQESDIKTQQQLLTYFHQIENKLPKQSLKKFMLDVCIKLLNDQFKEKKNVRNIIGEKNDQIENLSKQNDAQHDNQEVYNDESRLFGQEILQKIHTYFPHAYQLIDKNLVSTFNCSHSSDILDLLTIELENPNNFKELSPIICIIQDIVLPVICTHPDFSQKGVEIINTAINYFEKEKPKKTQLINEISKIVASLCLSFSKSEAKLSIQQIISIMTAVQAIQSKAQSYNSTLANSKLFHTFIYKMLLCSNVDSKTANSIAVNIYGALLKHLNLYCNQAEIFINLYSTLRCFGAHLVKDMWPLFYDFIEIQGNNMIFTKAELIDIIFYKIQHHENANVVKHCIQSILQEERSFILFDRIPDAIFNSLIRILNYGMHYLDCLFHMDSKMFPMISNFFGNYFNNTKIYEQENFERQIKLFINAIYKKITFDHALVAIMHSFTLIKRQSCAISPEEIEWISALVKKFYVKYPIRKKHQMMNGVCELLANHLNTQKRRFYLKLAKSQNQIDLHSFMRNCLSRFPEEYVLLIHNGFLKKVKIYEIIEKNFGQNEINQTLINYTQKLMKILKISTLNSQDLQQLTETISLVQFLLFLFQDNSQKRFQNLESETMQNLREVYSRVNQRYVTDLGESLYKNKDERLYGIKIQKICLSKIFTMKFLIPKFDCCDFIEKALTNVSLLVKDVIDSELKLFLSDLDIKDCQYIVKMSFEMIYQLGRESEREELQEKACRSGSQFLEWATDHIEHNTCHMLILTALKTRVQESQVEPICYIEESVYNIFWALFKLQTKSPTSQKNEFHSKVAQISPLYRLRLMTLCASILFYDDNEVKKFYTHFIRSIDELADRYDFENLDQILYFVELIFTTQQKLVDPKIYSEYLKDSSQTYNRVCKVIDSIIETMLTSLNYGVDSKEVISCCNCILNIVFDFASKFNHFSPELISLSKRVLDVGQEYWMFERMMTFKTIQNLSIMLQSNHKIDFRGLFPLLTRISSIEEYRGYDSGVSLEKELSKEEFYTELKLILHKESDYEGITCRLGFIEFINSLVEYSLSDSKENFGKKFLDHFLQDFFIFMFTESKKDTHQKMFMTGEHKNKLKLWQTLLAYSPHWIIKSCKNKNTGFNFTIEDLIIEIIQIVDKNNNIFEVKYYIELFLMKLMINDQSQKIVSIKILNLLSQKLVQLSSQVNKNVSFIFISGSVMNFMFRSFHITKNHPLYESLQKLYNTILIYSCSHVAYFRGLSQYFCLERLFIESEYTKILHQTVGKDADTVLLKNKLNVIVNEYFDEIKHWTVRTHLFTQLPTLNGNIVSETFYMDKLKKLGQQLLREIRAQIGFYPYKQIWLEACKAMNLGKETQIDLEKEALPLSNQDQVIFQRKIDPSLDFVYFSKTKLEAFNMKILITGSKSLPIYGHLSRTGQIFGLSELIIPCKQIVQDQEFKNVACTAEKWLNISWFSNKEEMVRKQKFMLSLRKELVRRKQEGYEFFMLKKEDQVSQDKIRGNIESIQRKSKVLLILDSQNYLESKIESLIEGKVCFGKHFSQHVEASIVIWEYFRSVYGKKFRTEGLEVC